MKTILLDTGPLVAWFCPRDKYHDWAKGTFSKLKEPCLTTEAVVTEACHLVSKDGVPRARVLEFLRLGNVPVHPMEKELEHLETLLSQYNDIGMDYADASLVRIVELMKNCSVCTVDRDFLVYRTHKNQAIQLVSPFS